MNNSFDIAKYKKNLGSVIVVFNTNHHIDVFYGDIGWTPSARFEKKRTPKGIFVQQISGAKVPPFVFKRVLQEVS